MQHVPQTAGNVGPFLLQRNIKIGEAVTFSRSSAIRYNAPAANRAAAAGSRLAHKNE
jgi:hypothetical protein